MTMVCNNCLQEILAGESFWEDETEGPAYHEDCRQAALDRRNKAEEERDAASARAEAAEADNRRLTARVAELESQLAAQQWRPVTEDWPPTIRRWLLKAPSSLCGGPYPPPPDSNAGAWDTGGRGLETPTRADRIVISSPKLH
jgi:hypothetical protein